MKEIKFNKYLLMIGVFLIIMGLYSLFIKMNSVEYIDDNGTLHENFFLIPLAYLFLFSGIVVIIKSRIKNKKLPKELHHLSDN